MSVPWGCTRELLLVDYGKCGVVWLVDLFQLYFMEAIKNFMSLTLNQGEKRYKILYAQLRWSYL